MKELVNTSKVEEFCMSSVDFESLKTEYPATNFLMSVPASNCMAGCHSDKPYLPFTTHRRVTYSGIEGVTGKRGIEFVDLVAVSPCRPHPNPNAHPYPYPNTNSNTKDTDKRVKIAFCGNFCFVATHALLTDPLVVHRHFNEVQEQSQV